jgi:hypothetical protein
MKNYFFNELVVMFTVILLVTCKTIFAAGNEKIIGVKIYEYKNDKTELINAWKKAGINTVFASVELLSDKEFKKLTKENRIKTFVILPIFFDEEALAADSSLYAVTQNGEAAVYEWVKFVCPSNEMFIKKKIEFIKDFVKKNNPDGISLDFIRHFVFWEKVYPERAFESLPKTCFDEKCVASFCTHINTKLPADTKTEQEIYNWIKQNHFDEWVEWKCGLITNNVMRIVEEVKKIKPDILVNLHAVPWRQNDFNGAIKSVVGQDIKELAKYADYISPMTYSHMVKREPAWINSVVKDMKEISIAKILPSIQVGIAYLKDSLTVLEFDQCLTEALKEPSSGVVFWNWNALALEKEKYDLVKKKFGTK